VTQVMAVRRPRKAVVALAAHSGGHEPAVETLAESLGAVGVETMCLGRVDSATHIAAAVSAARADAVELFIAEGSAGVPLLRELLRELIRLDMRSVSVVVHRIR
jgi:methylmalonyl-CoA mutase cobalamin-binding subunit